MKTHQGGHFLQKPLLVREAPQKRQRRFDALLVVAKRANALLHGIVGRTHRLAQVMAQHRKPDNEVLVPLSVIRQFGQSAILPPGRRESVQTAARVVPHVALGMPLGVLPAADEPLQFGIVLRPSDVLQEVEALRDLHALGEKLRPLAEESLGGEALRRHAAADFDCLRRGVEVETRHELHAAENAERILREVRRDMTEDAIPEIGATVPRIEDLVRQRVLVDCVDSEVTSGGRLFDRQRRIVFHFKRAVPQAQLRLPPRHRHVDLEMLQLDDAEGDADEVELELPGKRRLQISRGDSEAFDVEVLGRTTEQFVADASADQKGAAARPLHQLRDGSDPGQHVTFGP